MIRRSRLALFGLMSLLLVAPAAAKEKPAMPDLAQTEKTCFITSITNLMLWFGHHGYPNLIQPGKTDDERDLNTLHMLMATSHVNFETGTAWQDVVPGVQNYAKQAGYRCEAEYRGYGRNRFTREWLEENDDPSKGFVIVLDYCTYNPRTASYAIGRSHGHAITLVNTGKDTMLVHDPAHWPGEMGRKLLTTKTLTAGTTFRSGSGRFYNMEGFMELSSPRLHLFGNHVALLTGALEIRFFPDTPAPASAQPVLASTSPAKPAPEDESWVSHLIGLLW